MPVTSNLAPQTPLPPVSDLSTSGTQPGLRPGESGVPDPMAPPAETGSDTEADTEAVAGPEAELPDTPPAPQPPEPHAPSTSTRPAASADTGTRTAKYGARMHLLELNLLEADDRESLIATALDIASVYADRVALFLVHQGTIQGVTCRSLGDEHAIDGVLVPLNAESMLSAAAQSEVAARVEPGAHPIDRRLLGLLDDGNSPQVPDAGIYPVSIRGRIVNLLYADNREARLAATSHGALIALAEIMAEGYERLILRRKGS
jgi:urease beta subunit